MAPSQTPRMHSAEHLLNQAMVRRFSCGRCFSAHINSKKSKCDYHFDRPLEPGETAALEEDVNGVIQADLAVIIEDMEKEEALNTFDLGRVPDMEKSASFRVVRMGDYDACPCIGEHVSSTAQIGQFRITSSSFDNGVLRIRFKLKSPA